MVFPGGGGFALTFPVAAGDECLVVFASRCIDDYETGVRLAQEKQGQISTSLRLGTIYAMQGKFFSRALDDFGRQCAPDLKITL